MKEVRRSIVRICFDWQKSQPKRFMVIAGVIISFKTDGSAVILANSEFFENKTKFVVNFPNETGYEEEKHEVSTDSMNLRDEFYIFTLKPNKVGYIQPARFETNPLKRGEEIDAFIFPREGYITATGYCRGSVV